MDGEDVGDVLAHGDSAFGGFAFDEVVDDAVGPCCDLGAVTFVRAARLSHAATLPWEKQLAANDTPHARDVFVIGSGNQPIIAVWTRT